MGVVDARGDVIIPVRTSSWEILSRNGVHFKREVLNYGDLLTALAKSSSNRVSRRFGTSKMGWQESQLGEKMLTLIY